MIIVNVEEYLADLRARGFYGDVILIFENGKIKRIKKGESILVCEEENERH